MTFKRGPRKRILLIAMANSIHVARWIDLMVDMDVDVRLISSNPSTSLHPRIASILARRDTAPGIRLSIPLISQHFSMYLWAADRFLDDWLRGLLIFIELLRFRPSLVHVLELQNAGYPLLKALKITPPALKPKVFITNYGSDVYWYKDLDSHVARLKALMKVADAYSAECERDVQIAKGLGFKNQIFRTAPVTGGMGLEELVQDLGPNALRARKVIALKGYQGQWGRAIEALECICNIPIEILRGFTVEIYSCEPEVKQASRKLSEMGISVKCHPKGALSHEQVLEIFRKSRVYVGLSVSDGISTSMLEAMSQGAVPVQTNTSCANEWLTSRSQGFIASLDDPSGTTRALQQILSDDDYVLRAQSQNIKVISDRYEKRKLKKIVEDYYSSLLCSESLRERE